MSSPTKPTACIDDLPPEMICELFKHLPPKDLTACSMVNKRWHSIHAAFKLHRLAVLGFHPFYELIKFYGSSWPIQEAERCDLATFLRLAEKPLLSNLKHLALSDWVKFDLNKLNRFQQLVHLEIHTHPAGEVRLNLPRLKVLSFCNSNDSCDLSIDCPELSTLTYFEADYFKADHTYLMVKHPEKITKLETNMFGQQLTRFKSVECLVTWNFQAISQATLLSLPSLRELRYDREIEKLVEEELGSEVGTIDHMKRTVNEFLGEAKKLRGRDFRFTFSGFLLTNVKLDQIDFGVQVQDDGYEYGEYEYVCNEYIYLKNYQLIEPDALHFVKCVCYSTRLSSWTGEFPRCFSQKFTGIEEVEVDDAVKDEAHLLWFLKSLKLLRTLELDYVELSQEFYDQLPTAAHSLVNLNFRGNWETELQLSFDFIARFAQLSDLTIDKPLSLNSATSLARRLGGLKAAFIRVRSGEDLWIKIERGSPVWMINSLRGTLFETKDPDEIVNFLMR